MGVLNLSDRKAALRQKHMNNRILMTRGKKSDSDSNIFKRIISLDCFIKSEVILTYVSTELEVDTKKIIEYSIKVGKKVAVPVSSAKNLTLNFYFINSVNRLKIGNFSILEPDAKTSEFCDVSELQKFLCVVPGMVFDLNGHRIGYGKGYYDRFLKKYSCQTVGLCYEFDLLKSIPKGQNDVPVDLILTEKQIVKSMKG